jgi:chromosome segregation ATPase
MKEYPLSYRPSRSQTIRVPTAFISVVFIKTNMSSNQNLNMEISQLKNTIQKETSELSLKEAMSRTAVMEENSLSVSIKKTETEIKQKETEIQRLKAEIQQFNNKASIAKRKFNGPSNEMAALKRSQVANDQKLKKLEAELVKLQTSLQKINTDISQLKNTIQKENSDMTQKEATSRASVTEENQLLTQVKTKETEIKQKEAEIQRLKSDNQQFNNKLSVAKNNFGLLSTAIAALKRSQMSNTQQLRKLEAEAQDALRRGTDVKGIKKISY